ncbi:amino acid ABC transporter permease [Collinsella sp. zg1085]|uniref:amino acid ABC transporter permease n=1 Tax=Collinsella sp. zg1085 TaxID=2844380 RepID=UPI001C0DA9B4|nr:amino acid ABC transporter permease [Collinsella sp. zg1085]QWT17323.1 amino acid ABC transporter permease [Collinsella sp. zg1085]
MSFNELWAQFGQNYLDALLTTWGMTAVCFIGVMVVAIFMTVLRVSPVRPLRWLGDVYVQIFRNIPGVSLLILVVYALPNLNITLDYMTCVLVTVILVAGAFGSENFMSGINTIGVGQVEAARSLGMSFGKMLRLIIIPQALRQTILPMTNLLIAVMLTTALGSQVPLATPELTGVVSYINTRATGGILAFAISALGYALTALVMAQVGSKLDKKVRVLK